MSKEKLVPRLRFEEFKDEGEWEEKSLSEVALYRNGKAHESDINDSGDYIVVNSKFVSTNGKVKKYTNKQNEPLFKEEIAFVLSDVPNGRAIARTFLIDKNNEYTLNQRIAGITVIEGISPYFLYELMNRNEYFLKFDDGVKQTNLSKDDMLNFESHYPIELEQKKIGEFLEKLDNLISVQEEKIAKSKDIKSAYLSEMFPKEGEKYPRKRFMGFETIWGYTTFEDILRTEPFKKYLAEQDRDGIFPIVQQGDNPIYGYTNKTPYMNYNTVILFGDHTLSLYKPNMPFLIASDGIKILSSNMDRNYLYYLLQRYIPESEGYKRHYSILKKQVAFITDNKQEQIKIGQFFKNLDKQISVEEEKLDKLEKLKQAYLNDMFV